MRFYLIQEFTDEEGKVENTCLTSKSEAIAFVQRSDQGNVVVIDIDLDRTDPEMLVKCLLVGTAKSLTKVVSRLEILTFELFLNPEDPRILRF